MRALDAFTPTQVKMSGPAIDVSPKHALALSLALHELATNATKYGALSSSEGRVIVQWRVQESMLHLDWEESGGPRVAPPVKQTSQIHVGMSAFDPKRTVQFGPPST
jgi:two-component sensor histidine kinase